MAAHKAGGGSHSLLGASGFHRWSRCPPSVNLQIQLGLEPEGSSEYANEGTAAHYVAEQCFVDNADAWEFAGEEIEVEGIGYIVDKDMVDNVQMFLSYCRSLPIDRLDVEQEVEIDLEALEPYGKPPFSLHGTADAVGVRTRGSPAIYIGDFKYGAGIRVEPDDAQLFYYALGVLQYIWLNELWGIGKYDLGHIKVVLFLVQPRHDHPDGPIRVYETTADAIWTWGQAELLPAVKNIDNPRAPYVPGDHCQFCPVRKACPMIATAFAEFTETGDPRHVPNEVLSEHLDLVKPVRQYIKALDETAYAQLREGQSVPGYKLVEKYGDRTWKEGAFDKLVQEGGVSQDQLYESKPLTPAKAEKIEGLGPLVQQWAYKPTSGWTVAPQSDKREEVKPRSAQDVFANA